MSRGLTLQWYRLSSRVVQMDSDSNKAVIGLYGIAHLFDVPIKKVRRWYYGGELPPIDYPNVSHPTWHAHTIARWIINR